MTLKITAANSIFTLLVPDVFAVPQQLHGFGVEEAFDVEPAEMALTMVGVDGDGVGGWVPHQVVMTVTLLPSSPSFFIFDTWVAGMENIQEVLYASANIIIPSIERTYTCHRGILTHYPPVVPVRRTLQNCQFEITWLPDVLPAITSGPYVLIPTADGPAAVESNLFILNESDLGGSDLLG